ncbi:MAG: hypothetical protein ACRDJ3_06000 [Solirubrobacteraceae bacterium]
MRSSDELSRRELLVRAARLTGAGVVASMSGPMSALGAVKRSPSAVLGSSSLALPEPPLGDADYWAFADWCQGGLDPLWNTARGTYSYDARVNAALLITHSLAALEGHSGPTRQDERARLLTERLLQSPPYLPGGLVSTYGPGQLHTPGFVLSITDPSSDQHVAIDPEITEGLVFAWRARTALGLPAETVAAIERLVAGIALGRFYRYPSVRLNQFNWSCEMYAYAAEVAGRTDLLRNDYRLQLTRFLRGCRTKVAPWAIPNLSGSYSFHRNPFQAVGDSENVESTEYANIVLGAIARYSQARAAGMKPLPARELSTLRAWIERAIPAYWTHSGYPNWDTGVHPGRWNTGHYWAFCFDGLLAIATAPEELREPELGQWAKYIFDRALSTYTRLASEQGPEARIPGSPVFSPAPEFEVGHWLFATRFQSQAVRAVHAGVGRMPSVRPPSLYAFDPSIGRLAITTPTYNTAVMAVSNGAFPYGGIELARLFDGDQRVAGGVAPYGASGFGVTVTEGGVVALNTQTPYLTPPKSPPIVLTRSPDGPVRTGRPYPEHPYAGAFEEVQCSGEVQESDLTVRTTHTFTRDRIHTAWEIRSLEGKRRLAATVRFPSWGHGATISAVLRTGAKVTLGREPLPLRGISRFEIRCGEAQSGYSLHLHGAPTGANVYAAQPGAQSTNARPGPQLVVELAHGISWRELEIAAELIPGVR